jgi:hypothetical protein
MARNNSEAQKRADQKYNAKVKRIYIELYPSDADVIEHLDKQGKKQTYIKNLIREDMAKEQN